MNLVKSIRGVAIVAVFFLQSPLLYAAPLSIEVNRADATVPLRAFEKAEFSVALAGGRAPYANPYDSDEVALDATLTGPGGQSLQIPGFWQVPYQRSVGGEGEIDVTPREGASAGWRVRLSPMVAGHWSLKVTARDAGGQVTSSPLDLQVAAPAAAQHGFVERTRGAGRARYFQYSDGAPYFAVGENLCWSWGKGLGDFDEWLEALHQARANFARVWMAFNPLEDKAAGLRHYDQRNAAYLDDILSAAQRQGVTCMLTFGTYGEFTTGGNFNEGKWNESPYNAANGGPIAADKPADFFTAPTAKAAYQNRLRYIVARYGAYTGVGFWELWNEKDAPADWIGAMAAYLKQCDPYRRPVTNSYPSTGPAAVWNLKDIDLSQTHRYGDEGSLDDIAAGLPSDAANHAGFGKPHLVGEFGITWRGPDSKFDPNGLATNLHNGLWSSALSGNAGGAATWWWDNYVQPKNLYHEFTPLADFAQKVDWPRRAFEPLYLAVPLRPSEGETFSDLQLQPIGTWGAKSVAPVEIGNDGALRGGGTLLSYLYNVNSDSMDKKDFQGPLEIALKMPSAGTMRLVVGSVSNAAELRVKVDGEVAATFKFDASPAGAGSYQETKHIAEYGTDQARFDVVREVPLSAGPHRLVLENVSGDWVEIKGYEFTGMRSSRYTTLRTTALQDKTSGETLVWIQNPASNWRNDRDGKSPASWRDVTLEVPVPGVGPCQIEWWDTHLGRAVGNAATVNLRGGQLSLPMPAFTRDIALRVIAANGRITASNGRILTANGATTVATAANYRVIAAQVNQNLRTQVLDQWFPRAINAQSGGYDENFSENWTNISDGERSLVYQARLTWLAAQAALRFPESKELWLGYSTHGANFLRSRLWDARDGGFFWELKDGAATRDGEKHTYGIAFAIYALAAHYRASQDRGSLDAAIAAFHWLDSHAHDALNLGYFEALSRTGAPMLAAAVGGGETDAIGTPYGYKSMNTHIHLLEAFAALYEAWPDQALQARLREVFGLVRDTIVVSPPGAMNLYFRPDWKPVPFQDSFGHDIETAYLLVEAAGALGMPHDARTWAVARSLVDHTLDVGQDGQNGGFNDAGGAFGEAADRAKIWWTQAEALNALLLMDEKYGAETPRYWDAFARQWEFIQSHQIDRADGGWYRALTASGEAIAGATKSDGWTEGYHQGRALLNVAARLERMSTR